MLIDPILIMRIDLHLHKQTFQEHSEVNKYEDT